MNCGHIGGNNDGRKSRPRETPHSIGTGFENDRALIFLSANYTYVSQGFYGEVST
jgi:hypothetical protein